MSAHYVFWTEKASSLFLSGSTIQILPNHRVVFKNERMAPSCVIHEWRSNYNFQGSRRAAVLPNLSVGKTYTFQLNASVLPEKTLHIKVNFFNQFNEVIDYVISTHDRFSVTVPENTYTYGIQLINAGCHTVDFSSITIHLADTKPPQLPFYQWQNVDTNNKTVNILFMETSIYHATISENEVNGLSNLLIVPCTKENKMDVLSSQMHVRIKSYLQALHSQGIAQPNIRFIGYGALSNFMALAHSRFFEQSTCHITDLLLAEEDYHQLFNHQFTIFKDARTILSRLNYNNVSMLSMSSDKPEMFRLQSFLSLRAILLEMQLITKC